MKQEHKVLLMELCFLAKKRNEINTRRHRARFRKNYYANAIRVVEAHNKSNSSLRRLQKELENVCIRTSEDLDRAALLRAKISISQEEMAGIVERYPNPVKWKEMGLHKLRSLELQGAGEYAMAKHETMEFSIIHRERVKYIVSELNCQLGYDNGSLSEIHFKQNWHPYVGIATICKYADQYELNEVVEDILQE